MRIAIAILAALVIIVGCSPRESGGITTTSHIFNAKYAAEAGLTQAEATICNNVGQNVFDHTNEGEAVGRNLAGGKAFEACVDTYRRKK